MEKKNGKKTNLNIALAIIIVGLALFVGAQAQYMGIFASQQPAGNAQSGSSLSFAVITPIGNPITTRPPITTRITTTIPPTTTIPSTTTTQPTTTQPTTLPTTTTTTPTTTVQTIATTTPVTGPTSTLPTTTIQTNPVVNSTNNTTAPTTTILPVNSTPITNSTQNTTVTQSVSGLSSGAPQAIYCYFFDGQDQYPQEPKEPFGCFNSQGSVVNQTTLMTQWPGFSFGGVLAECAGAVQFTGCNNVAYFFDNQSLPSGVGGIEKNPYTADWLAWALVNNNCIGCVGGATDNDNFVYHTGFVWNNGKSIFPIGSTYNPGPTTIDGYPVPANYQTSIEPDPYSTDYTCLQASQQGSGTPNSACSQTASDDANGAGTAHWYIEVFYPSSPSSNPGQPGGYLGPVCGSNWTKYVGFYYTNSFESKMLGSSSCPTVGALNAIVSVPSSQITEGQNETITSLASGGQAPYTYSWTVNGNHVGTNSSTLTFFGNSTTLANSPDSVHLMVTDSLGDSAAGSGTVTVIPQFTNSSLYVYVPKSTIDVGQNELISATVFGTFTHLTYAWTVDGNAVGGNSSYITFFGNSTTLANSPDNVQVAVTTQYGQHTYATNTVKVNPELNSSTVSVYVPNSVLEVGQSEHVIANVMGGTYPYSYVWYVNGNVVAGTSNTITFTATNSNLGNNLITVNVTDSLSESGVASGHVQVNNGLGFGSPNVEVSNSHIEVGQSTILVANVMGGTTPYTSYVWKFDGNVIGTNSNTITFNGNASTLGSDTVFVTVTDSANDVATGSGTVTVASALTISQPQPPSQGIDQNDTATLTATQPTDGFAPYTYQWLEETPSNSMFYNATNCATANALTCTFYTNTSTQLGTYNFEIKVTDSAFETATSASSNVIVNPALAVNTPIIEAILIDPIDLGQAANVSTTINGGTPPYSYQWQIETPGSLSFSNATSTTCQAPSTPSGSGVGAGNPVLCRFITNSSMQSGTYSFRLYAKDSNNQQVISSSAALVTYKTPTVSLSANSLSVNQGQYDLLTAQLANGSPGPFTVNFIYSNGTVANTVTGVTQNGIATYSFNASRQGSFTFNAVAVDLGTTHPFTFNSVPVTVSVSSTLGFGAPQITIPSSAINYGQSETVTANVIGGVQPYASFAWYVNGNLYQTSASNSMLFSSSANPYATIGNNFITVTVTDHDGAQATGSGNILVSNSLSFGSPQVTVSSAVIDVGQSTVLTANVVGGTQPYTLYVWKFNGNTIGTNSNTIIFFGNASTLGSDTVSVTVTDSANSMATGSGHVQVNSAVGFGSPQVNIPSSVIDVGQSEQIVANVVGGTTPYTSYVWKENGNIVSGATANTLTFTGSVVGTNTITVTVTDSANDVATGSGNVQVNSALTFGTPQVTVSSATIDIGQNTILTANVMGGTTPYTSYVWKFNGNTIGTNSNTLIFYGNSSTLGYDTVFVTVTDSANAVATGSGNVQVNSGIGFGNPQITIPNSVIDVGQTEYVVANVVGGSLPYTSYVWKENGVVVSGATTNTLTFTGSVIGTNTITVTVTDNSGAQATGTGNILVNSALTFGSPQVTVSSASIDVGQSTVLTANVVGGTQPYTLYVWTFNGNTIGTNSNTLVFYGNASTLGSDTVSVQVTDSANAVATGSGHVQVSNGMGFGSPQVTVSNAVIDVGQSTILTANVMGGTAPYTSYVWKFNGNTIGTNSNTITFFGNSSTLGSDTVSVTVTDSANDVATGSGNVQVNSALTFGTPQVTVSSATIDIGQNTILTANVMGGTTPYTSYVWKFNGNTIGTNSNTLTFYGNASTLGSDTVFVTVTDSANAVATGSGNVQVNSGFTNNNVYVLVPNSIIDVGQSESITANVFGGTTPYSYAWTVNGNPVGTNSPTLTFFGNSTTLANSPDSVQVTIVDSAGQHASASNTVIVNPAFNSNSVSVVIPNSIIEYGQSEQIVANVVGGTAPYTYVWTENGNVVAGATTNTITFTGTIVGSNTIGVTVTDHVGQSGTAFGTVTVNNKLSIGPTTPGSQTIDQEQNATITGTAPTDGVAPYTYVWHEATPGNSMDLLSPAANCAATNTLVCKFVTSSGTPTGTYQFELEVMDSAGFTAYSSPVSTVQVNPALNVSPPTIDPVDQGQSATLSSKISGGTPPYSYTWYVQSPSGGSYTAASAECASYTGSASANSTPESCVFATNTLTTVGTYSFYLSATDNKGVTTNSAVTPLLVYTAPTVSLTPATTSIDVGQRYVFTAQLNGGSTGPFTVDFMYANGIIAGTVTGVAQDGVAQFTFVPSTTGIYTFNAVATDPENRSNPNGLLNADVFNSLQSTITVSNSLTFGTPNVTIPDSVIDVGESETITANVMGGSMPYSYSWIVNGNHVGSNSKTLTFYGNSSTLGNDLVSVTVTDSANSVATASGNVLVNAPPIVTVIPNPTSVDVNNSITFSNTITGGTGPYTVGDYITNNGTSNTLLTGNTITLPVGNYTVYLNVTDGTGTKTTGSSTFSINKLPQITSFTASSTPYTGQSTTLYNTTIYGTQPFVWTYTVSAIVSGNYLATSNFTESGNGFVFTVPGLYFVQLTATDADSNSASANMTFNITNAPPPPPSGGGTGGGGGGGGSGGSILPTVTTSGSCSRISNLYPPLYQDVVVNGIKYDITNNFITPTTAGITINNVSYTLSPLTPVNITETSTYGVYVELLNITYVPSGHMISLNICSQNHATTPTTTIPTAPTNSSGQLVLNLTIVKPVTHTSVTAGTSTIVANLTKGGVGPYTYTYIVTPDSGFILNGNNFTFESPGNYTIELKVTDSKGNTATANTIVFVSNALAPVTTIPATTAPTTSNTVGPAAIAILIAIAMGVAYYGYARRRRGQAQ